MNYLKIYKRLIDKRKADRISRKDCYVEKHHILPKAEGYVWKRLKDLWHGKE